MPDISSLAGAPIVVAVLAAMIKMLSASRLEARISKHVALLGSIQKAGEAAGPELPSLIRDEVGEMVRRDRDVLERKLDWTTIWMAVSIAVLCGWAGAFLAAQDSLLWRILGGAVLGFGVVGVALVVGRNLWEKRNGDGAATLGNRAWQTVGSSLGIVRP